MRIRIACGQVTLACQHADIISRIDVTLDELQIRLVEQPASIRCEDDYAHVVVTLLDLNSNCSCDLESAVGRVVLIANCATECATMAMVCLPHVVTGNFDRHTIPK